MTTDTFTNEQIFIHQLPDIAQLQKQPLSEKYAKTRRLVALSVTLFVVFIFILLINQPFFDAPEKLNTGLTIACWIAAIIGLLITAHHVLADPRKSYALREHDISFSSGIFFKDTVTQPILRVQHIELKRGPIERKVGLATLQVFSAGGAMHTFEIPGLPVEEANQIRELILQHKDSMQHG